MAKTKKGLTISSPREKEIERSYISTQKGRLVFIVMFLNTVILLVGLLLSIYAIFAGYSNIDINNNISKLANKFLIFGGLIILFCLYHYINFSNTLDSKVSANHKEEKIEVKPAVKIYTKKTTSTKKTTTSKSKKSKSTAKTKK